MEIRKRSAGVVVVYGDADGFRYLLLRAYRNWDFPKGAIEPGETHLEAALREVREETTLDDLVFRWGHDWCETAPYNGKVSRYYLACTGQPAVSLPVNPELGRPEHHAFLWAGYETALRLLPPRLIPILQWARALSGDEPPDPGTSPGAAGHGPAP